MDLAAKDSYIQKLASRVCSQQRLEQRKKPLYVPFKGGGDTGPSKKNKPKPKSLGEKGTNGTISSPKLQQKPPPSVATAKQNDHKAKITNDTTADEIQAAKEGNTVSNFSTVDVLRKRLHEKIEESRVQGTSTSEAVLAKRAKRKLEKERRKRKRKEFQIKKLAEEAGKLQEQEIKKEEQPAPAAATKKRDDAAILFNTVEMVEEEFVDKVQKKKDKKKSVKGNLTPLTGKNYKQLLSRVEARKAKLEQLREKDEDKARDLEQKMKWTNVLYKAEGLKIKDNEDMLRASLKRKEKMRSQRKKQWEERSQYVVGKMQQRQDKRRKNIQKRKKQKMDKAKDRARKKGRVLPEDLRKAAV